MTLSELKKQLRDLNELHFELPNGRLIPAHFHITEVGQVEKTFIDCGGTLRKESRISLQLWSANDYDHRLKAEKLRDILSLAEEKLGLTDTEIEVEYQGDTIGKYQLSFNGQHFLLQSTTTACLAEDQCGIPQQKPKLKLSELQARNNSCTPGGGCC